MFGEIQHFFPCPTLPFLVSVVTSLLPCDWNMVVAAGGDDLTSLVGTRPALSEGLVIGRAREVFDSHTGRLPLPSIPPGAERIRVGYFPSATAIADLFQQEGSNAAGLLTHLVYDKGYDPMQDIWEDETRQAEIDQIVQAFPGERVPNFPTQNRLKYLVSLRHTLLCDRGFGHPDLEVVEGLLDSFQTRIHGILLVVKECEEQMERRAGKKPIPPKQSPAHQIVDGVSGRIASIVAVARKKKYVVALMVDESVGALNGLYDAVEESKGDSFEFIDVLQRKQHLRHGEESAGHRDVSATAKSFLEIGLPARKLTIQVPVLLAVHGENGEHREISYHQLWAHLRRAANLHKAFPESTPMGSASTQGNKIGAGKVARRMSAILSSPSLFKGKSRQGGGASPDHESTTSQHNTRNSDGLFRLVELGVGGGEEGMPYVSSGKSTTDVPNIKYLVSFHLEKVPFFQ